MVDNTINHTIETDSGELVATLGPRVNADEGFKIADFLSGLMSEEPPTPACTLEEMEVRNSYPR